MTDFDIGRHEAMLDALDGRTSRIENTVAGFDQKLDEVLLHLAEKRGERKMLFLVASAVSAAVSVLIAIGKVLMGARS